MLQDLITKRPFAIFLCCVAAVGASRSVAEDAGADGSVESKASICLGCHAIDSFSGYEADALATVLAGIVAGEIAHMPLPPALSDQDVAPVAAYLVDAASAGGADAKVDLANGERKGRSCLGCHALENFATYEAGGLATYLRAILAGETGHMRIPATLSDQDIADAAAWLVSANADSGD
ncbi:MAG: hypothetical protein KJO13_10675 [Gammaproteobacteria bacterium]|nr:hypothetical protein [Gammaproteobacteria bacterium]